MTKNAVDLVRDAVASLNKIEAKVSDATRLLASSCMVFYSENGGNKKARELLAPMLHDVTGESTSDHILAWVGKNLARYEVEIKAAMPEGATAARDAVLRQFGDRPWNKIRSEHKPPKAEGGVAPPIKQVPPDGPLKRIDPPAPIEVQPIAPVDAILNQLEGLDNDALTRIADAASAILTERAEKLAAEQAQPEAQAVNG